MKREYPLTERQAEFLRVIRNYARQHQQYPTIRVLADLLDIRSPNGVVSGLKTLEKKGYLNYKGAGHQQSRRIRLAGMVLKAHFTDDYEGQRLAEALGEKHGEQGRPDETPQADDVHDVRAEQADGRRVALAR